MKVLLLVVFLNAFVYSNINAQDLKCSDSGTRIIFVNGVLTNIKGAYDNNQDLKKAINSELVLSDGLSLLDEKNIVEVKSKYYNNTSNVFVDFFEAMAQAVNSRTLGVITVEEAFVLVYRYVTLGIDTNQILSQQEYQELLAQAAQELAEVTSGDIELLRQDMESALTSKKKLIVVSHSQGNFFATSALEALKRTTVSQSAEPFQYNKYEKIIGNLRVASPENKETAYSTKTVTNSLDFLLWPIIRIPAGTPDPTFTLVRPNPIFDLRKDKSDLIVNHGFSETYLFRFTEYLNEILSYDEHLRATVISTNSGLDSLGRFTVNELRKVALGLESNCTEQCFDPEAQAVYEARRHTNPDGKEGGLVSIDSIVDSTVHIDPLSVVCGISNVSGEVSLWGKTTVINSVLNGRDGGVFIDGGDTPVHQIPVIPSPTIIPSPIPNVFVRNANLEGNIYLLGKVRVLNSKLDGKSSGVYVYGGSSPNPGLPVPSPSGEDFNGWAEFNVTIDESEVLASEGIGIDIVNSYVYKGKVQDEAFLLSAVLNNAQIKNFASIEGGEADAFSGEDIGLPAPELIISGDSIVKGTVVTQTKTHIESSLIDKKGIVSGNAIIRSSQVSGQVLAYDDAVATTERPMAEVVNSRLEEMGIVFNSGKMLFGALIGHRNDPAQMVGQSFIFDKAILANGAAFTDGAYISESAYVGGNKVFMTRTHVFGNARVNSNEGGGTAPNSAIHESRIHDQAQVLGSPFVKQSAVYSNAIIKNNAQVIKSEVGSGFVLDGEFRFICSQLEIPFLEDPVTEEDCSNPVIPTAPAPASAARTIASVSPAEIENDESIQSKLGREKSRATICSQRIKGLREKSVYSKVVKKIEDAEAKLSNQLSLKKRSNGKRISSKELERMNDSFKKQKSSKAISLAKANKKDMRERFNKFKKKWMKKKI